LDPTRVCLILARLVWWRGTSCDRHDIHQNHLTQHLADAQGGQLAITAATVGLSAQPERAARHQ